MSWAAQYIGEPWVAGEHDCWSFFRRVQAERFGCDVPVIEIDAEDIRTVAETLRDHDERRAWQSVDSPREGDAVLMAHARYPSHIGVWVDDDSHGGVLHCVRGDGVVFSTRLALELSGWRRLMFYRHAGMAQ